MKMLFWEILLTKPNRTQPNRAEPNRAAWGEGWRVKGTPPSPVDETERSPGISGRGVAGSLLTAGDRVCLVPYPPGGEQRARSCRFHSAPWHFCSFKFGAFVSDGQTPLFRFHSFLMRRTWGGRGLPESPVLHEPVTKYLYWITISMYFFFMSNLILQLCIWLSTQFAGLYQ